MLHTIYRSEELRLRCPSRAFFFHIFAVNRACIAAWNRGIVWEPLCDTSQYPLELRQNNKKKAVRKCEFEMPVRVHMPCFICNIRRARHRVCLNVWMDVDAGILNDQVECWLMVRCRNCFYLSLYSVQCSIYAIFDRRWTNRTADRYILFYNIVGG